PRRIAARAGADVERERAVRRRQQRQQVAVDVGELERFVTLGGFADVIVVPVAGIVRKYGFHHDVSSKARANAATAPTRKSISILGTRGNPHPLGCSPRAAETALDKSAARTAAHRRPDRRRPATPRYVSSTPGTARRSRDSTEKRRAGYSRPSRAHA